MISQITGGLIERISKDASSVVDVRHAPYRTGTLFEENAPIHDEFAVTLGDHAVGLNEGQLRILRNRIDVALETQRRAIAEREEWR